MSDTDDIPHLKRQIADLKAALEKKGTRGNLSADLVAAENKMTVLSNENHELRIEVERLRQTFGVMESKADRSQRNEEYSDLKAIEAHRTELIRECRELRETLLKLTAERDCLKDGLTCANDLIRDLRSRL